jgi:drug/metabolite transporter (DMT)-like permease
MSFEEKSTWIYAVIVVALAVIYFAIVLGQLPQTAARDIEFQVPLVAAIGAAIGLSIAAHIVVAMAAPDDAGKRDQRDKDINRYGEYVGGLVLSVSAVLPLILALAEADHFWIANTIYLAFILGAASGSIVKIVAYRRGL